MSDKFIAVYAGALTAADIGKKAQVRLLNGTEITGKLAEIEHKAEQIENRSLGEANRLVMGQTYTYLTLLGVRDRFKLPKSFSVGLNPLKNP